MKFECNLTATATHVERGLQCIDIIKYLHGVHLLSRRWRKRRRRRMRRIH